VLKLKFNEYHKTLSFKPWGFLYINCNGVMMTIERLETKPRMSRIVKHNGTVYLCGQVCADATKGITEQTQTMLDKVETLLTQAGSSKQHMLSATIYLKTMADFSAMNAVWDAWVPEGHAPARACVEAAMARDVLLVEISVVAAEI
jgi:enamine deaminase RidA (YjgF/YER057c/UK114 family)